MITRSVEWESEKTRLVRLHGLRMGSPGYRSRSAKISSIIVHQSAGNNWEGQKAAEKIANFHAGAPRYKTDPKTGEILKRKVRGKMRKWWIGGGRGWPGIGYTFVVPYIPAVVDGKFEVYRCQPDKLHTYHTGRHFNRHGVAVCFAGNFGRDVKDMKNPDPTALIAGEDLILNYLLPLYKINKNSALLGHFDAGKKGCPGGYLEQWVRHTRGEDVDDPRDAPGVLDDEEFDVYAADDRTLKTYAQRQQALIDLGYDLGTWGADGYWGEASKGALLAYQYHAGLAVDGRWGTLTEHAIRMDLFAEKKG